MRRSCEVFRAGTRASRLALVQTRSALDRISALLPGVGFETLPFSSPGDRDRVTDLRESPPDFFTRDLDAAVSSGTIDCALHSAKDLPDPMRAGMDWFWLPWREDPRDAIIVAAGRTISDLPPRPRVGVSSGRREDWCARRFPGARMSMLRGNIDERLVRLDSGDYDVIVMAGAALLRLGLEARITEWIPLEDLAPPEGQGFLALTFRSGDPRFLRLRSLFVKTVTFVGAGAGKAETCTLAGMRALQGCDACLHDTLLDEALLESVPAGAKLIDVGKRCGQHGHSQPEITELITLEARKGHRVVRLKGGDPGLFGRLSEEIDRLDALHLPYRVIPGVSSLTAATTGTGMLLTRRGVSRGFSVMTPRAAGGGSVALTESERLSLPLVLFMAVGLVAEVAAHLMAEGASPDTPAAMVFDAGCDEEIVVRRRLADIAAAAQAGGEKPGLLIVGQVTQYGLNRSWGALSGRSVLLTCSEALQDKAADLVLDSGGLPLRRPLIRLVPTREAVAAIAELAEYDWLVLSSPSSARVFFELAAKHSVDLRSLPRIMACGPGTEAELRSHGFGPDAAPVSDYGSAGIAESARSRMGPGTRVLRLRSDKAGTDLADSLRGLGALVEDRLLYHNEPVGYDRLPAFDAVFFASASAVEVFDGLWGSASLAGKTIAAIGGPTVRALKARGVSVDAVGPEATVEASLRALAAFCVRKSLKEEGIP